MLASVVFLFSIVSFSAETKTARAPAQTENAAQRFKHLEGIHVSQLKIPLLGMVSLAQQSLDIEIYEMHSLVLRQALRDALKRGVKIRIVHEPKPIGDKCRVFDEIKAADKAECKDLKKFISEVQNSPGSSAVPFAKPALCAKKGACYEHGKMVIADQSAVLLSTGNFNSSNLCDLDEDPDRCNRDYSVVTLDPSVISGLQAVFEKDLAGTPYQVLETAEKAGGSDFSEKATVSPHSMAPLVDLIGSATDALWIQNQYLKDPEINAAIVAAAKKKVKVYVLLSSVCSFGRPSEAQATKLKTLYGELETAGVKLKFLNSSHRIAGVGAYLHAKAIVAVNGAKKSAWVGSVNGSTTSIASNREFGILSSKKSLVNVLAQQLEDDFRSSDNETLTESLSCLKDGKKPQSSPDDGGDDGGDGGGN